MRLLRWRLGTVMIVIAVIAVDLSLCVPARDAHGTETVSHLARIHALAAVLAVSILCVMKGMLAARRQLRRIRSRRDAEHLAAARRLLIDGASHNKAPSVQPPNPLP